jgi:serine phosphatase RsbU (regulator of sigma subunit)
MFSSHVQCNKITAMSNLTHDIISQPQILCIDDSKLNRAVIRNTLTSMSMVVDECENGMDGLAILQTNRYDLVLVDTVMPVMDGIEFIKEFKQNTGSDFTPVILMTGNDDLNSKIKGLNIGADDFLQKPVNQKELVARVFSLLRLKKAHDLLVEKNMIINKELQAAKKIQQFIIPDTFSHISYPSITGRYLPKEDIGGDFFDVYPITPETIGFLIADVTGHGIPAALIVTMTKMIFSIYAPKYKSTAALLTRVNSEIHELLLENQYITGFYAIYNKEQNILRFTNAGHVHPYLYRRSKNKIITLDTNGFFLGIQEESVYEEKAVRIEKGDRLFLFTDGITELRNYQKNEFGNDALKQLLLDNHDIYGDIFCNKILQSIKAYSYKNIINDDISFLNIEF